MKLFSHVLLVFIFSLTSEAKAFSVKTLNVLCDSCDGRNDINGVFHPNWDQRRDQLILDLLGGNPAFILLQEVEFNAIPPLSKSIHSDIIGYTKDDYDHIKGGTFNLGPATHNNLILIRKDLKVNILSVGQTRTITQNCMYARVSVQAKINREILSIYNCHFPVRAGFPQLQIDAVNALGQHLNGISLNEMVILGGDFNAAPQSATMQTIYSFGFSGQERHLNEPDHILTRNISIGGYRAKKTSSDHKIISINVYGDILPVIDFLLRN